MGEDYGETEVTMEWTAYREKALNNSEYKGP